MENISTSHEHSGNNNLNQVLIGECQSCALIAGSKVDAARSGKKPLSQGEMQIRFGVDKRTVGDCHSSSSARCLVCVSGPLVNVSA
jgi:hypothetical protein